MGRRPETLHGESPESVEKMGQGEEVKTRSDPEVEIQERGEIFFFYRPKVGKEEAHGADDVQRLYIVLRPESGERSVEVKQEPDSGKEGSSKGNSTSEQGNKTESQERGTEGGHGTEEVNIEQEPLLRFIVMGKKSLPNPARQRSRPYWGFVELVTTKIDDIKIALKGEEYETATRAHREKPPARALAEGVYRILKHKSGARFHTHLVYKLEFPPEGNENEPQECLNVEREGSFVMQIKNPKQPSASRFSGLQNKRKAAFPAHLQAELGRKRFSAADPPDFLNYEGCEFLLIAASDDIDEELGMDLKTDCESDSSCSDLISTFGEIASTSPLLKGTWV
ncbi:hypothetical protein H6P81_009286 [Aristolochia fimbriata]|uniref:Uncharacterized protein n=1 Tax=Aristolochia fimbriata TaxID=158543 RepID=A0AAV7EN60_ARIFI|nr:hypothetical protein H6P81_009286 [Aristolochia fimbriata]